MRGRFLLLIAAACLFGIASSNRSEAAACKAPKVISFWNYWTGPAIDGTSLYTFKVIYSVSGSTQLEFRSYGNAGYQLYDTYVDQAGTYTYQFNDDPSDGAAPRTGPKAYETVVVSDDCADSQPVKAELLPPGYHSRPAVKQTAATLKPQATVGMPFTGLWAYNVKVRPVNGKYNDSTSSHPSVHAAPGHGDWATDLYAPVGEPVRLHVSSAGKLSFSWVTSSGCPSSTKIEVRVDSTPVGYIYYTHLSDAVRSGTIRNGMVLGYVADPKKDGGCNPAHHVHVELKNIGSGTYSCWTAHGLPGASLLKEGTPLGILGSSNKARRQACSNPSTKPTPVTQPKVVTPTSPKVTVTDRWPTSRRNRPASLLVYLGLRFRLPAWSSCNDRFCIVGNRGKVYVYLRHGTHYMQLGRPVGMKADPRTTLIGLGIPTADVNRLLTK